MKVIIRHPPIYTKKNKTITFEGEKITLRDGVFYPPDLIVSLEEANSRKYREWKIIERTNIE